MYYHVKWVAEEKLFFETFHSCEIYMLKRSHKIPSSSGGTNWEIEGGTEPYTVDNK